MKHILIWVLFIFSLSLLLHTANSAVEEGVKTSLISFLAKLNGSNTDLPDPSFGWNMTTDPCVDKWKGVTCDSQTSTFVRRIQLNQSSLSGTFDVSVLCNVQALSNSLYMIKLDANNISGQLSPEIVNCKNLRRLHLGFNRFVGNVPDSLTNLTSLQRLDLSYNNFSGNVPNLSRLAGLDMFLVHYNQLSGRIPNFDLTRFGYFNVSFNDFTGPVPDKLGRFTESSFLGNPRLCGEVLKRNCVSSPNPNNSLSDNGEKKSKSTTKDQLLLYTGYGAVGFVLISVFLYMLWKRKNRGDVEDGSTKKVRSSDNETSKPITSSASTEYNNASGVVGVSKSEFSASAAQSPMVSTSLVVLTSPQVSGLKFDDLLRAPAELIGRGTHGSLYKVICENGMILAVKRIKDWGISCNEFKQRMQNIFKVNHPNVLPVLAFYCSAQEKLLVYEYQQYGSLHKFLHGTQAGQSLFDWTSRLNIAASIAEALAVMHQELLKDGIAHGNLKASNILLNKSMQPCISKYGLMEANEEEEEEEEENPKSSGKSSKNPFKKDVRGFGVILLQLLTGKVEQKNGMELAKWVDSVVREEWTVEVFDKKLITEGASEERMLNLLQIAIKCVNKNDQVRPTMSQVGLLINAIKDEEDKSLTFDSSECEARC